MQPGIVSACHIELFA